MTFGEHQDAELDDTDRGILTMLQEDCRSALARIGEHVGLSAPSVLERIKKLEAAGVITGYHATLDARRLGFDVTAFIGVITSHPNLIATIERQKANNTPVTVGEVQTMRLAVYDDGAAMIATHVMADNSRQPYQAARVWVKRNGQWQMAISVQTDIK